MHWRQCFKFKVSTSLALVILVLISRIIAWLIFDRWDVVNDSGIAIKPLGEPAYLDYINYRMHIDSAWSGMHKPLLFIQYAWSNVTEAISWLREQPLKPGPFFSTLLHLLDYERFRAPLAWLYLLFGGFLGWLWAMFFAMRNMKLWMQVFAASFPALVYYSFLVSTDLLYAVLMAFFYASAWAVLLRMQGAWIWCMGFLMAALLSRPNALAMIPVLFVVLASESALQWRNKLIFMFIFGFFGLYMTIYYLPYYWIHEGNAVNTHYWGIYPQQFHKGLFPGCPLWLNQAVSLFLLAVSKLVYSVGLRPSYADLNPWLVLARAWPGVLLLPGLIYGLLRGHWFDRIFVFFFLLPVYVGAAQERYLLSITPLLLLWGFQAYNSLWRQWFYRNSSKVTA
jgi:hypothetical protein